jgi:hypothetical protein
MHHRLWMILFVVTGCGPDFGEHPFCYPDSSIFKSVCSQYEINEEGFQKAHQIAVDTLKSEVDVTEQELDSFSGVELYLTDLEELNDSDSENSRDTWGLYTVRPGSITIHLSRHTELLLHEMLHHIEHAREWRADDHAEWEQRNWFWLDSTYRWHCKLYKAQIYPDG